MKNNWKLISEEFPPILPTVHRRGNTTWRNTERVLVVVDQTNGTRMVKEGYAELFDNGAVFWRIPGTIKEVTHWMPMPDLPDPIEWVHSYGVIERNEKRMAISVTCGNCGHIETKSIQFNKCQKCNALWDRCMDERKNKREV